MDTSEDIQLIERFKNGDESAFNELVKKYMDKAYNIAYGVVRNTEDAKDVSQESFIRAYNSISEFREESSFYTWFYRIVVNMSLNHLRKNRISAFFKGEDEMKYIADTSPDASDEFKMKETRSIIDKNLDKLSSKQKAVFELKNYQDLSLKEISNIMNCSIGTVKSHLFRAVKCLKKNICMEDLL